MEKKTLAKPDKPLPSLNKRVISVIVILLIFSAYILYSNFFNSRSIVARSIPVYSNSVGWNVESKGAFPDDPSAILIVFISKDSPEKIINFYNIYFINNNWKVQTSYTPSNENYSVSMPYSRTYFKDNISVNVLVKPSMGNVSNALNEPETKGLNSATLDIRDFQF